MDEFISRQNLCFLFKKKNKTITALEFKIINNEKITVIDVKNKNKILSEIIPNAIHISVLNSSFKSTINKLDQTKKYVVYCRSGIRSARACQIMEKLGFKNIYNLKGGLRAWNKLD